MMMTNNDDGQNSSKMISRKEKEDVATQYMVNWNKDDQRTPLDGWMDRWIESENLSATDGRHQR